MSGPDDVTPVEVPVPEQPQKAPEKPPAPPRNGWWKKATKMVAAAATAAAAAYGAARTEPKGEQAQAQVDASHRALTRDVIRLQRWARSNRSKAEAAEATCRAEVAALQAFTSGFLLGQSGARGARRAAGGSQAAPEAVEALVRALKTQQKAAQAKAASSPKLPKLNPPEADVQQLLQK